jgi:signal transduction histidine kinase
MPADGNGVRDSAFARPDASMRELTSALYRAAVALGQTRDAAEVVRVAIAETQRAAGVEAVALYILDGEGQRLVLKEFAGTSSGLQERMRVLAVDEAEPVARAIREHQTSTTRVSEYPALALRAAFTGDGFQHVTVAPVAGQHEPLGMLCLASRAAMPLSPEESALVHAIGGLVGVALENAALREGLGAYQARLKALASGTLRAREEEARRIAHELHDEAGQLLASLHITIDELASQAPGQDAIFRRLRAGLDRVEAQLRRLSHELRPTILDDLGLRPALEWLAQGLAERRGLTVTVDAPDSRLAPEVETALYRIVQEAVTNALRHAQPRRIRVEVREEGPHIRVVVRDDGRGFDVAAAWAQRGDRGLGLIGMRERTEALGGTLEIRSTPGAGTEVCAMVPGELGR